MNIYIDTNILLSFFHLTSDDLEELGKLVVLLKQKKVRLLLPQQTSDEFHRNRENKIADAIKRFRDQKLNLQFPAMCKDYKSYAELRKLQKEYEKLHSELLSQMLKDIDACKLKADALIAQLFALATPIANSPELVERARLRMEVGNPPGKDGSFGDAINWEALMEIVKAKEDLYFISDDKDYCSPLNEDRFNEFLVREWEEAKKSKLRFYKRLSAFFKDTFPDIKLAQELEKDLLIQALASSGTFASTHNVVAKLAEYGDFTASQANDIVNAALSNNQVLWIIGDNDVRDFLSRVVNQHADNLDPEKLAEIVPHLQPEQAEVDEIPF
jgi:predicted nucleic acid-binding protein